jgi:DDE superfamily endonuclease
MWCIPKITTEFVEKMEDVLTLYSLPYNEKEPVICFDEKSKELHKDSRKTIECTEKGQVRKRDYEYIRNGTANIFMTVEPLAGFRSTQVTERRTRDDFAKEIKRIINLKRYLKAEKIHIVLDNLNTHNEKSLIQAFGKEEADQIMKRIKFHNSPKHASWLNMAEIELSIMHGQCTKKRVGDMGTLKKELQVWEKNRNKMKAKIKWGFTVDEAKKLFKIGEQN